MYTNFNKSEKEEPIPFVKERFGKVIWDKIEAE